jgi:hypothetical protein
MSDVPVLLIVYRRPEPTALVLDAVARAKPSRLFVAADGPVNEQERDACERARAAATAVTWPCQVLTDFSETNLGCRIRVTSAVHWFFDRVDRGIVLEDDCVPAPDFFPFCAEMLDRYADDDRIVHVSGETYATRRPPWSYTFSKYALTWGWATWRRAWQRFDERIGVWPELRDSGAIDALFDTPDERMYWTGVFQQVHDGLLPTTWDYSWWFACLTNGLSIRPAANLIQNVGGGPAASHTANDADLLCRPVGRLPWPLHHPPCVIRDREGDLDTFDVRLPGAALKRQRTLRHHAGRPFRWLRRTVARR